MLSARLHSGSQLTARCSRSQWCLDATMSRCVCREYMHEEQEELHAVVDVWYTILYCNCP